jgi:hypothetical protein
MTGDKLLMKPELHVVQYGIQTPVYYDLTRYKQCRDSHNKMVSSSSETDNRQGRTGTENKILLVKLHGKRKAEINGPIILKRILGK